MDQKTKKWYVVRAMSGKEKKAKEYIESEIAKRGWQELVPQVLIPTEKVVSIRNGKKVVKDRNYFPGYVLIEAVLLDEIIPVIQNVTNVLDFLKERDGKPIPMRQSEVNRILGKMDDLVDTGNTVSAKGLRLSWIRVIRRSLQTQTPLPDMSVLLLRKYRPSLLTWYPETYLHSLAGILPALTLHSIVSVF